MSNNEPWVFLPKPEPVPEPPPETAGGIILWWERRRLKYNFSILAAFLLGLSVDAALYPGYAKRIGTEPEWNMVGLFAVIDTIFCLFVLNLGYAGGWVVHLLARPFLGAKSSRFGAVLRLAVVVLSVLGILTVFVLDTVEMISGAPPRHR